ncbi:hypothetical protein [Limnobacter sp.]|uniref:hypothetical protein n=1 Tax=Limnobacter sp. TaxID=2003368 RepID=UPI003512403F
MSTQVIGTVNEIEGTVSVMRDGQTVALAAGDSINAGDVITASDSGRASIMLSNSYGEPIGNLLVAPTGSVIADTTMKNGQTAFVFEALSNDGVTIANLDPDFADLVELQGVEQAGGGGMFGLFDGGLLAAGSLGSSGLAVGAGAIGVAALASGSDEGSGPRNTPSSGSGGNNGGNGGNGGDGGDGGTGGTTGTPLDAALDPVFDGAAGTPLAAVSEPLADGLGTVAGMLPVPGGDEGGGDGGTGGGDSGGDAGGTTGTPLDAAFDPIFDGAAGTPLAVVSEPLADGLGTLAAMSPAGGGSSDGPTGTPLDAALDPVLAALDGTPLSAITSMADPSLITDALGGGLPV